MKEVKMLIGTTTAARRAAPGKHVVGSGLYLNVTPSGTRSWRLRWRDARGCEQLLTIGTFPEISLDAARARRDAARAAIAAGDDPRASAANDGWTFEAAARAWHAHRAPGWSAVHAGDVLRSLERDVLPALGALALDAIARPAVLQLLRVIETRGAIETARRVRQRIEMVFAFARAEGWTAADNPADVGEGLANAPARGRHPALVDVTQIRALLAAVEQLAAAPIARLASMFLALTGVRLAALRGMTWDEVDDLDGAAPLWRVPAARIKLKAVNKRDAERDHLVPLVPAAVAVLRQARREADGGRNRVFPIGEGALNELYARAGFAGRHCAHGWRASLSTVMNERRPADRMAIDRTLGHLVTGVSAKEAAYNRAQHLELRRSILREWAELIGG